MKCLMKIACLLAIVSVSLAQGNTSEPAIALTKHIPPPVSWYTTLKLVSNELPINKTIHTTRVINGYVGVQGEFPYQCGFQMDGQHFCGGAILTSYWVISAAHCFTPMPNVNQIKLHIGSNDLRSGGMHLSITRIVNHPSNIPAPMFGFDISLIQTSTAIPFNDMVQPIPLYSGAPTLKTNDRVMVSGWGSTDYHSMGIPPTDLRYGYPELEDSIVCQGYQKGYFGDAKVCTRGIVQPCPGDSGGPLVVIVGNQRQLIGTVSHGWGCGVSNVVLYEYVPRHMDWINRMTSTFSYGWVLGN